MAECVIDQMEGDEVNSPQGVADCIANKAQKLGMDPTYFSPFALGAAEANLRWLGGKLDDISVVVA